MVPHPKSRWAHAGAPPESVASGRRRGRHNWLVLERAIVESLENVGRYVSLREIAR
jgi:hypothetical protein